MRKYLLLLLLVTAQLSTAATTSVSRNPTGLYEAVNIIFTANSDAKPNFTPLQQNFEILEQSQTSVPPINSEASQSIVWRLQVVPKQNGIVTIPSIDFGSEKSPKLELVVGNKSQSNNQIQDLFIEVTLDNKTPLVQAQVIYTVKIFTRYNFAQASITSPNVENAIVESLDDGRIYTVNKNSVKYQVLERKFAIFPQKSGEIMIKPVTFTAEIISNNASGFFNGMLSQTKRSVSEGVHLLVLPAVKNFTGNHWLPSKNILLQESWSGDLSKMKLGEPLTRTIVIIAQGNIAAQLPKLYLPHSEIKTYPNNTKLHNQKTGVGVVASREEKTDFIADKAGEFIIPAVEVAWFNTRTQTTQTATIGARAVNIIATKSTTQPTQVTGIDKSINDTTVVSDSNWSIWLWLTVVFAGLWLLTLWLYFTKPNQKTLTPLETPLYEFNRQDFKFACLHNQANVCKNMLLEWGKHQYSITSLAALAAVCDTNLGQQIIRLNQYLYASKSDVWQGKELLIAFKTQVNTTDLSVETDEILEPLHKL